MKCTHCNGTGEEPIFGPSPILAIIPSRFCPEDCKYLDKELWICSDSGFSIFPSKEVRPGRFRKTHICTISDEDEYLGQK